ncbi:hypothetical protein CYMTET_12037 [Cymbomonas tetramitiformis]|uniref:Uncharacterized protein n=1 Tax=Cymbomonas tetramitiformis TaxID=36881 RepID=A0AAE0LCV7_9CHLO|nr:hypothetical protein CYMTET_12037 [Cymbomonas tetramitiformis]
MAVRSWFALSLVWYQVLQAVSEYPDINTHRDDKNIVLDGEPRVWKKLVEDPEGPKPFKPFDDKWNRSDSSIVIMIASFREERCSDTLVSMFGKAKFPARVYMAIVQQNHDTQDEDCLEGYCRKLGFAKDQMASCPHIQNVRMLRMKHTDAKGPVYARARQVELLKDTDDFCVQIDAHTDVVQDWDVLTLREWGAIGNEYAVISTYPTNIHDLGKNTQNQWMMPHLCDASFAGSGRVVNGQAGAVANLEKPWLAPLWAAGLSLSRCHAERNVPADINLKGVFAGEEYGRGSRLWTNGYDFYSSARPYLGTYYGGEKHNKGGWGAAPEQMQVAEQRLKTLLRWPGSDQSNATVEALGSFGLGKRRTLEQYWEFSGINTMQQTIKRNCRVNYVPWAEDMQHTVYSEHNNEAASRIERLKAQTMTLVKKLGPAIEAREQRLLEMQETAPMYVSGALIIAGLLVILLWRSRKDLMAKGKARSV